MPESESLVPGSIDPGPLVAFDKPWWETLLRQWNLSDVATRQLLAGAGAVAFEVVGEPAIFVFWDGQGFARLHADVPQAPRFQASAKTWRSFVDRDWGAASGVIEGRIAYYGSVSWMLPFVRGFDALAEIGHLHDL